MAGLTRRLVLVAIVFGEGELWGAGFAHVFFGEEADTVERGLEVRVVLLADGETVHNAFFDRRFTP